MKDLEYPKIVYYQVDRYKYKGKFHQYFHVYECICTQLFIARQDSIKTGHTKSCGCLNKSSIIKSRSLRYDKVKNALKIPGYKSWSSMLDRCGNPNCSSYEYYGLRGIKVCERWLYSFKNFIEDMGERPNGMSLDRINPDGNYEPSNCRWATAKQQRANQRKKK